MTTDAASAAESRVIAIDGPAGSGKSTVAREVARRLGLPVLDTGAMYRAVTLAVIEAGVPTDDAAACSAVARSARIEHEGATLLDGRDVGREIRGPQVTASVSAVSAHVGVREVLVARQRAWAEEHGGGVVEGRDIGTVVFPGALLKVFVTASEDERARRRQRDEQAARRGVDAEAVRADLGRRDALDSARSASPLRRADDALVIDTTALTVEAVVERVVAAARERYRALRGADWPA